MIFESYDLLYNVMFHSHINLSFVNKLSFEIYNNQHYWKTKINKIDDVNIESNNYKIEYKNINNAYHKAVDMTEVMILMKKSHIDFDNIYMSDKYELISLDSDLYWLPNYVKLWKLELLEKHWIVFTIDNDLNFYMKVLTMYSKEKYSYNMPKHEFINFFSKLFYHYPDVIVDDSDDDSFMYNKNKMYKYDQLKNISDNKLDMFDIFIKYWGLYMENK